MVKTCIVKGCRSRTRDGTECRFFSVPAVPRQLDKDTQQLCADRHRKWIEAAGHDASEFDLKKHHRICSVHFVSGTCYLRCVAINQLVIQCRKSWAYQRHFVFMLALYWISNSVSNTPPVLRFPLRSARILISALSLGAYYCQQLTLSVCLSRCLSVTLLQIASFLFLDGIEPFFDHQFFMWHSTKTLFFDFWFRPPNAQNYCPEFTQNWLLWQIDRRCLGLLGGFQGWPIQWNHAKCCAANPCHGNEICTESSLSRLVWQIDWRCLGLPGVFGNGRFNGTMQNVVGPTLVAMATTFGIGTEIQSPTGLSIIASQSETEKILLLFSSLDRIWTFLRDYTSLGCLTNVGLRFSDLPQIH